jgi:signal transduction histidine kinase
MFTANAAHELRTPLTTMRTAIDVTLDSRPSAADLLAMTADIRAAVDQSQRTLEGLLALAQSQAGAGPRHRIDLADLAEFGATSLDDGDLTVRADLRPAPVIGEPVLLERMCGNLVENAIRHNHSGGHVELTTGIASRWAFLRIANSGPSVASETVARLREPFVRGEGARIHTDRGTGLGLSIVDAIVAAHRGELVIAARPTGGLDVTVRLPVCG